MSSEEERRKKIGIRLSNLRKKSGKTLETVSKDLGVTRASVSYWENGERMPLDTMKQKIAEYYQTDIVSIFYTE